MPKITFLLVPAVIAIVVFLAINEMNPAETRLRDQVAIPSPAYSAWSEGIDTVIFDSSGDIAYTIAAERQVYFEDETSDLDRPEVRFYDQAGREWNLEADSGRVLAPRDQGADQRDIELIGNVQISNVDSNDNLTLLLTDRIMLHPAEKAARTDDRVQLRTMSIEHSATGMVAYLNRNRIEFLRDGEGRYVQETP